MNGISIVIISRGREKLLAELIESVRTAIERVDFPTEIVLVDSTLGEAASRVEAMSARFGTSYYYQDISVSAKRNFGAEHSKYDTILFLDSDCIATPDILKNYAEAYAAHPEAGAIAGPLEFVGEDKWFWKVVEKTPYTICFGMARWGAELNWAPTANFSVTRAAFDATGGFDEHFQKNPGGEDVDFGLRIRAAGYHIFTAPDALVYHSKATWSPVKAMFRRVFHYGAGDCHLVSRYDSLTCKAIPGRLTFMFFGMLLYLFTGILLNRWLLAGIVLFPLAEILITAICVNLFADFKSTDLPKQLVVQLLLLFNEAGFKWECIRTGNRKCLGRQVVHFPQQLVGVCYQNVMTSLIFIGLIMASLALMLPLL